MEYYTKLRVEIVAGGSILANTSSAIKHIRLSRKRTQRNRLVRSRAYTFVKRAKRLIEEGQLDDAAAMAARAGSALDKAAQKGVIHKNTAARKKSRLMKRLNRALSVVTSD